MAQAYLCSKICKNGNDVTKRERANLQPETANKTLELPDTYTILTPVAFKKKDPEIPETIGPLTCNIAPLNDALQDEMKWQKNTQRLLNQEVQSIDDPITWAAFHSNTK